MVISLGRQHQLPYRAFTDLGLWKSFASSCCITCLQEIVPYTICDKHWPLFIKQAWKPMESWE